MKKYSILYSVIIIINVFYLFTIHYALETKLKQDSINWNYKKHGEDWNINFNDCRQKEGDISNSPINFDSEKINLYNNPKGTLVYSSINNYDSKIYSLYNGNVISIQPVDISKNYMTVYSLLNINDFEELEATKLNCYSINLKLKSEHTINNKVYDMELQFVCKGKYLYSNDDSLTFVNSSIFVNIVESNKDESEIFKNIDFSNLEELYTNENEDARKPLSKESFLLIGHDELFDHFALLRKFYFYKATDNIPPCSANYTGLWLVYYDDNSMLNISRSKYNQLYEFIKKNKNTIDGNNSSTNIINYNNVFKVDFTTKDSL